MAIDAKVSFMSQAEKRLASEITAYSMTRVMTIIADVMENFEIRETFGDSDRNDDLLDCFIDALRVQGRSELTLERYRMLITKMISAIGVPTRRVTVYHLRNYLSDLQKRGLKDSTIEGTRQVFSSYFNWLQRESLIDRNPTANLGTIKVGKKQKKVFTEKDIKMMEMACGNDRDRAVIAFLYATGCRISEMTGLDRTDVHFMGDGVAECVVHGKGNKERKVYINPAAGLVLWKYLEGRTDDQPALFINRLKKRLRAENVRDMLNVLSAKTGIEHIHPHKFRRTRATDLARKGMKIQEIAWILGHEKIDTTMKYVVQNDDEVRHDFVRYAG